MATQIGTLTHRMTTSVGDMTTLCFIDGSYFTDDICYLPATSSGRVFVVILTVLRRPPQLTTDTGLKAYDRATPNIPHYAIVMWLCLFASSHPPSFNTF